MTWQCHVTTTTIIKIILTIRIMITIIMRIIATKNINKANTQSKHRLIKFQWTMKQLVLGTATLVSRSLETNSQALFWRAPLTQRAAMQRSRV